MNQNFLGKKFKLTKKFYFFASLPRSGSTVLSAILCQNPLIYTEGQSALAPLMLSAHNALNCSMTLAMNRKDHAIELIKKLPYLHYSHIDKEIIIDKNRAWGAPPMNDIAHMYFDNPKFLYLIRNIEDIEKSFNKLFKKNNLNFYESSLYDGFKLSVEALSYAKKNKNQNQFLFINYEDFIINPQDVINQIYKFFELPLFDHYYENIVKTYHEDDSVYGLNGMHDISSRIPK